MNSKFLTLNIVGKNKPKRKKIGKYTLPIFLERAKVIHGDKYDYSQINESHIKGKDSNIPIICRSCKYRWNPRIHDHISKKSQCPQCSNRLQLTLEIFLKRAIEIHGTKYDYSKIIKSDIRTCYSYVLVICNICGYQWNPSISDHIYLRSDCPNCMQQIKWTLERFLIKATEIHGDKYDYSGVTESQIQGHKSHVVVSCNKCKLIWCPSITDHISKKSGCPNCANSKGYSNKQIKWLESIMKAEGITIQYALSPNGEFKIANIGKVDGHCIENNTVYEYHGDFWHGNPKIYNAENINPVSGKTYGELYQNTINRDQNIRNLGYNLIVKWESDLEY